MYVSKNVCMFVRMIKCMYVEYMKKCMYVSMYVLQNVCM